MVAFKKEIKSFNHQISNICPCASHLHPAVGIHTRICPYPRQHGQNRRNHVHWAGAIEGMGLQDELYFRLISLPAVALMAEMLCQESWFVGSQRSWASGQRGGRRWGWRYFYVWPFSEGQELGICFFKDPGLDFSSSLTEMLQRWETALVGTYGCRVMRHQVSQADHMWQHRLKSGTCSDGPN